MPTNKIVTHHPGLFFNPFENNIMQPAEIVSLYNRDLYKLIEEISLFQREENLWKTSGHIHNPAGNLALHITGGLNHHIGATVAGNGYIRNRDLEFTQKDIKRENILDGLRQLVILVDQTLAGITTEQWLSAFPAYFDKDNATHEYVITQLLLHLNYHLGQINYLRRMLE